MTRRTSPTERISPAEFRARTGQKPAGKPRIQVAPKEQRTYNGRAFGSKGEAAFAARLDRWKQAGIVRDWEPQVRVSLCAQGDAFIGVYVVDFRAQLQNMVLVFFEIKPPFERVKGGLGVGRGVQDLSLWKMRHFRAQHPEWPLVVASWKRERLVLWPDTSLEDLDSLRRGGLVLA